MLDKTVKWLVSNVSAFSRNKNELIIKEGKGVI